MREFRLQDEPGGRRLAMVEAPVPSPKGGEVVVRVRAASLNYRDLLVLRGGYPRNDRAQVVPLSDGAGEISAVGAGVTELREGDRVAINFMRDWADGPVSEAALASSFGGGVDGVLADYVAVPASAVVLLPDSIGFAAAATLPCAGVTAWHGLRRTGVKPGDTMLTLGTGGVSIFALQFGEAFGARTMVTSSSDDKLDRTRAFGAQTLINYAERPDWDVAVREATHGRGADAVIELGGPGTFERSLATTRVGGHVALIGLLTDAPPPSLTPALLGAITIHGIYVGPTAMLREVIEAVDANGIAPVIDRSFGFEQAQSAYDYFERQQHVGKVVILNDA
jgi:NADPH:quinone reductase-like Zn-dependent oxidoreductase